MLRYYNNRVRTSGNYLELLVDYIIEYENESDESHFVCAPPHWDSIIAQSIDLKKFDIYQICACIIPHGLHNRITDYKKVWGLNNIAIGIYDNTYDVPSGRIYFGVKKENRTVHLSKLCWLPPNVKSILLLNPINNAISMDEVFEVFHTEKFDFDSHCIGVLEKLQAQFEGSYVLKYTIAKDISLIVCRGG